MDRIDPEHLREMGRKALRNLLDTQHSYIRELLDDDDRVRTLVQASTNTRAASNLGARSTRSWGRSNARIASYSSATTVK